jgi:hypothetical protein
MRLAEARADLVAARSALDVALVRIGGGEEAKVEWKIKRGTPGYVSPHRGQHRVDGVWRDIQPRAITGTVVGHSTRPPLEIGEPSEDSAAVEVTGATT